MDDALRIAFEAGLPFTGLRDVTPDDRLWRYVPLGFALEHRVVPMRLEGDVLHLAAASPHLDLAPLAARFPGLELALTIAPEHEIHAALARAQGLDF